MVARLTAFWTQSALVGWPPGRAQELSASDIPRTLGLLFACGLIAYLPFLSIPLISDDYLQIALARQYGHPADWSGLAHDVLYRSRATSLVLTFLTDQLAGPNPAIHRAVNIGFHLLNSMLILAVGSWRRIGYRLSAISAVLFTVQEGHQEAVVWTAALPEILVFFFSMLALLAWNRWLIERKLVWIAASGSAFFLALLSKESAVVALPLAAAVWFLDHRPQRKPLLALAIGTALAMVYAVAILRAEDHLHLNDGTFSLQANFAWTIVHSTARMFFPWGFAAVGVLVATRRRRAMLPLQAAAYWIAVTLLPYAFLLYMDRVPSRHTYFASVALCAVVALALCDCAHRGSHWKTGAILAVGVFVAHNTGYLWTKKLDQYRQRTVSTEKFLALAGDGRGGPIQIECAPFGYEAYRYAAQVRLNWPPDQVGPPKDYAGQPNIRTFCDKSRP